MNRLSFYDGLYPGTIQLFSFFFKLTGAARPASPPASPTCPGAPQCNVKVSQVWKIILLLINCQNTRFVNGQTHGSYPQPISSHAFARALNRRPALNLQDHMIGSFDCLLQLWLAKEIPPFFSLMALKLVIMHQSWCLSRDFPISSLIIFVKQQFFSIFFSLFRIWWLLH